jgi:hypothetical protein
MPAYVELSDRRDPQVISRFHPDSGERAFEELVWLLANYHEMSPRQQEFAGWLLGRLGEAVLPALELLVREICVDEDHLDVLLLLVKTAPHSLGSLLCEAMLREGLGDQWEELVDEFSAATLDEIQKLAIENEPEPGHEHGGELFPPGGDPRDDLVELRQLLEAAAGLLAALRMLGLQDPGEWGQRSRDLGDELACLPWRCRAWCVLRAFVHCGDLGVLRWMPPLDEVRDPREEDLLSGLQEGEGNRDRDTELDRDGCAIMLEVCDGFWKALGPGACERLIKELGGDGMGAEWSAFFLLQRFRSVAPGGWGLVGLLRPALQRNSLIVKLTAALCLSWLGRSYAVVQLESAIEAYPSPELRGFEFIYGGVACEGLLPMLVRAALSDILQDPFGGGGQQHAERLDRAKRLLAKLTPKPPNPEEDDEQVRAYLATKAG